MTPEYFVYTVLHHFPRRTTFGKMVSGRIRTNFPEIWKFIYIYIYICPRLDRLPPLPPPVGCGSQWVGGAANSLMNLASHDATTYLSQPEQGQALLFRDAFSSIHCQYSRSQSTDMAMLCLDFTAQWKLECTCPILSGRQIQNPQSRY